MISVVMAVKNGLPYLKESTKSILDQTYKDFEFIIVDDASTDQSYKYLKSLKDKRIKIIKNSRNLGLAASLNKAINLAKGQYIARMDADDISLPKRFEVQLEYLIKHPKVDICGSWASLIDERGNVYKVVKKPLSDDEIKKENRWIPGLIHPTWFLKKEVFEKLGGYDADFDMIEDYEFLLRAKKFKMANLDEALLLWRSLRSRRSHKGIDVMYKKSLHLRWFYFKKGEFGLDFLPYLVRSLITTFIFPTRVKIYLNKKAGLI